MSINDTAVIDYSHLITTRPHDIRRVVISDLHLSADEPALVQAFLALLDDLIALPNLLELYILGDWFDAWIGDDAYLSLSDANKHSHWLTPIIDKLTQLHHNGCQTRVMHGNRDFLIGQEFCNTFQGQLIKEPYLIEIADKRFRLEHGDALCTDDISYQRFRKVMRNPVVQWLLLKKPLSKRVELAQKIRQKSSEGKQTKSFDIMDVNQEAVLKALKKVDCLLHGHTHRPATHKEAAKKTRYVLGDWRLKHAGSSQQHVEAVIAVTTQLQDMQTNAANTSATEQFDLALFTY